MRTGTTSKVDAEYMDLIGTDHVRYRTSIPCERHMSNLRKTDLL